MFFEMAKIMAKIQKKMAKIHG